MSVCDRTWLLYEVVSETAATGATVAPEPSASYGFVALKTGLQGPYETAGSAFFGLP